MIRTLKAVKLGAAAAALAAVATVAAASVYVNAQNTSGQDPAAERRGPGRGPGGAGGLGRLGGPGRGGPIGRGMLALPIERLDLTDAQRQQVRTVMQSHDDDLRALNERARAAHQALQAAVVADVVDEGAIRARSADVGSVEADLAIARARIRSEVLQLLTPEQRAKAKAAAGPFDPWTAWAGRPRRPAGGARPVTGRLLHADRFSG